MPKHVPAHTVGWLCAIDFGGSSTKWAIRRGHVGQPSVWERQGKLEGQDHRKLWASPAGLGARLTALLVQNGATRVVHLGISVSGNVDASSQTVTASDRMAECFGRAVSPPLDLRAQLRGKLKASAVVGVCNDGVAAAVGAACTAHSPADVLDPTHPVPPILAVTLGSWPAIAVVSREERKLHVFQTDFSKAEIRTRAGQLALHHPEVLAGDALAALSPERKAKRIGRALAASLGLYWRRHKWQPTQIILLGGHSVGLARVKLEEAFKDELARRDDLADARAHWDAGNASPVLRWFDTYAEQSSAHLEGAAVCAELATKGQLSVVPSAKS